MSVQNVGPTQLPHFFPGIKMGSFAWPYMLMHYAHKTINSKNVFRVYYERTMDMKKHIVSVLSVRPSIPRYNHSLLW